jgi:hypothetical protein
LNPPVPALPAVVFHSIADSSRQCSSRLPVPPQDGRECVGDLRSTTLPDIIRTLETRRCEFARGMSSLVNYVTVETTDGERYAAFFELRRLKTLGSNAIQLMVQSAYVLDLDKPAPGKGRIHFHALLGHVLRGTNPRVPP